MPLLVGSLVAPPARTVGAEVDEGLLRGQGERAEQGSE